MKKRIYQSFILIVLPSAMLLAVLLSLLFHNAAKNQELAAVRDQAMLLSDLLNSGLTGDFWFSDYINHNIKATRMTIIGPDGTVLLDSSATAQIMENHSDRPEVVDSLAGGTGESLRYSDTLRKQMYYYAVKLNDGNILRISSAIGGLADVFAVALPVAAAVTVLILVLANFTARKLTERVIAPLGNIDFDSENLAVYEELLPFTKRIERQKQEINEKMAQLSDRANTISAITENMKEGLILIDNDAAVLAANNSVKAVFGDNIEGKSVMHVCRDPEFQNAVKLCLRGENAGITMERGNQIFSVFLSPVYSAGTAGGTVILFQDATERYKAEKQRREFSANVSHELKTPLTTISALSEMIESGIAKDEDIKSFAARISEQAGRLLVLIDDIIRLSEFDEGGVKKEDTVFDLWELASTVTSAIKDHAGGVEIRLTGERFDISANHRMFDELLYNLIENGVKYNKDGGLVTVSLERLPEEQGRDAQTGIQLDAQTGAQTDAQTDAPQNPPDKPCGFKISVSDTGIGIPVQHQARVFERFYRADSSRSKKTGGTGLGLSIVKHITEYYGGQIELQSKEGAGTTVTCYFN